jgi:cytochrome d ubiquinol oxidase subunit II
MCVLWLLMLRAIGVEFRTHIGDPVWRGFFDGMFSLSSILLAIFFGAALGNVIRGVPLDKSGYFFNPLWTNLRVGPSPGILDWYTVLAGLVALASLAQHGALYVATKTEGELNQRSRRVAAFTWPAVLVLTCLSLLATMAIQPLTDDNFRRWPIGWIIPVVVFGSLAALLYFRTRFNDRAAFVCSGVFIAFMLIGAAFGLYPNVLPASTDPTYSLTIHNTKTSAYAMAVALRWWAVGMILAVGYFVFIYRMSRGKVSLDEGYGHGD